MEIIRHALPASAPRGVLEIVLAADRLTLAKRRWRGVADDGREFGFDLGEPLRDGAAFFSEGGATYVLVQRAEPVLEIPMGSPMESAKAAWLVGNLHFPVQLAADIIRVADDPSLRQMAAREGIVFSEARRVFHPIYAAHSHGH